MKPADPPEVAAMVTMRSGYLVSGTAAARLVERGWAERHPYRPGLVRLTTAGLAQLESLAA